MNNPENTNLSFLSLMRTTPKLMKSMSPDELLNLRKVVNHYMGHFRVYEKEYTPKFVLSVSGKLGALNDALTKKGYPKRNTHPSVGTQAPR